MSMDGNLFLFLFPKIPFQLTWTETKNHSILNHLKPTGYLSFLSLFQDFDNYSVKAIENCLESRGFEKEIHIREVDEIYEEYALFPMKMTLSHPESMEFYGQLRICLLFLSKMEEVEITVQFITPLSGDRARTQLSPSRGTCQSPQGTTEASKDVRSPCCLPINQSPMDSIQFSVWWQKLKNQE